MVHMPSLCHYGKTRSKTFVYNSVLFTGLKFNYTVKDFLCPLHLFLIDFNVVGNDAQKLRWLLLGLN